MPAITVHTARSLADAEEAVRATLADNGFGVLTEIDVAATLKAKLDVDRTPLKILGACNPHLAHQALTADPAAALVLPCNVVLDGGDDGTTISAVDPHDIITSDSLGDLADDAAAKLRAALEAVAD